MTEHAIAIPRVSAGKQHEEDQTPGLEAYAASKGYVLDAVVPVHGRSAFHGKHVKAILAAVDKYVRNGQASVVIFRHVDRSSREGVFEGFDLLNQIMKAGARIEFSEQEFLNAQPGWIGPLFELAKEESKIKQARKLQGNAVKRAKGELIGVAPWGFNAVTERRGQVDVQVGIEPNELGRTWVPVIFRETINGRSLRYVCELLKAADVKSPQRNEAWNTASVRRIVANSTYSGAMTGNPNMSFEALVTVTEYEAANAAVASRDKHTGRGAAEPTLCKPVCGSCFGIERPGAASMVDGKLVPDGVSPMYRVVGGQGRWQHYVCKGHGPERTTCGAKAIQVGKLDAAVNRVMATRDWRHMVTQIVKGDGNDAAMELIMAKIKAATEASDVMLIVQLGQEAASLAPTERKTTVGLVDSGMTVGKFWCSLNEAQKRDELGKYTVVAYPDGFTILLTGVMEMPDDGQPVFGYDDFM